MSFDLKIILEFNHKTRLYFYVILRLKKELILFYILSNDELEVDIEDIGFTGKSNQIKSQNKSLKSYNIFLLHSIICFDRNRYRLENLELRK